MVTSPHTYFSRTDGIQNIEIVTDPGSIVDVTLPRMEREGDIVDNVQSGVIRFAVGSSRFDLIDFPPGGTFNGMNWSGGKWGEGEGGIVTEASGGEYNGCTICKDYSTLFGGNHKGRTINSEEEFELVKAEFVAHFNKYHQKLMLDKPKKVRKFKKVEKNSEEFMSVGEMSSILFGLPTIDIVQPPRPIVRTESVIGEPVIVPNNTVRRSIRAEDIRRARMVINSREIRLRREVVAARMFNDESDNDEV